MRILLIALLVAACSGSARVEPEPTERPTPTPAWPEFWDQEFCYGIDQLGDAGGHMTAAAEAGAAFDFDGMTEEAEQAAKDAGEAQDAFAAADTWKPAHSAILYLSSSAQEVEKAANLFVLFASSLDEAVLNEAIKRQEKSTYQLGRAQTSLAALRDKYGAPC